MAFPDAHYLILSSRLVPDLDGGYTLAALARARQMADTGVCGGRGPLLLTVDPGTAADHDRHRATFAARGLLVAPGRLRNLFDEAASGGVPAPWLVDAATPGAPDASLAYRPAADGAVGLPVIEDDPDWHTSRAPVVVRDPDGAVRGVLPGFGALYRAWLDHVVAGLRARDPQRPVVVLCESRQLGELIADWRPAGVRLIHGIHTIHLAAPYTPDAPVNALWTRWFAVADRFDAVLWLTSRQRDEACARFGLGGRHVVVPHAVELAASPALARTPGRVVMLNRLAPGKRVDHAVRAFAEVSARVPGARLDVYGDGAERAALAALVERLGVAGRVRLRGLTQHGGAELDAASALLFTSAFEGQGLAVVEALAHGCPVVSYDVRYGPAEALRHGGGVLVPDGDVAGLADALARVLQDDALRARMTRDAAAAAARFAPGPVMTAFADVVRDVLAAPARA